MHLLWIQGSRVEVDHFNFSCKSFNLQHLFTFIPHSINLFFHLYHSLPYSSSCYLLLSKKSTAMEEIQYDYVDEVNPNLVSAPVL